MKSRQEIKSLAKQAFNTSYWPCVGTSVLFSVLIYLSGLTYVGPLIISGPLMIGLNFFFINVFTHSACGVGGAFSAAFDNFGRKLGGYLWMCLFLFLWALIPLAGFVIAIIKALSYAMTPYILAYCPNVKAQDALKLSMRIMRGYKGELFVFVLSFIGWDILNSFTCGLLGVFYLSPWKRTALAGWFLERLNQALCELVVTPDELNGMPLDA